jgi:patatin-like phospholipase/acyl hydrolase
MSPNRPLRILSLDGGGVRGLTTLYVLREIMAQVSRELNQGSPSDQNIGIAIRPCDYLDLICGTSTGGLIAIMLGRLRYVSFQTYVKYKGLTS